MCSDLVACVCPSTKGKCIDGVLASRSQLPRSQERRLFRMASLSRQPGWFFSWVRLPPPVADNAFTLFIRFCAYP